jgi:hypothetical protein
METRDGAMDSVDNFGDNNGLLLAIRVLHKVLLERDILKAIGVYWAQKLNIDAKYISEIYHGCGSSYMILGN